MVRNRFVQRRLGVLVGLVAFGQLCAAQLEQPAFVDDAPIARDTLRGLGELIARGGKAEAARALQRLLDEHGSRVVETSGDPDAFRSVRSAVHERLLSEPALLETYAEVFEPRAARQLEAGDQAGVEASLLLTPSGYEAALRVAQDHFESARFAAAWRTLAQLDGHPSRTGRAAGEALDMALQIAAYRPADDARSAMLKRWARDLGRTAAPAAPIEAPPAALVRGTEPLAGGPPVDLGGVVSRPLAAAPLGIASSTPSTRQATRRGSQQTVARTLPLLVGDRVYASDGVSVSAWDRFTLRRLWSVTPELGSSPLSDTSSSLNRTHHLAFAGNVLIALTSPPIPSGRGVRAPAVHAIERSSGGVVWSVDPATIDERLEGADVIGPAIVEGDTVVISLRKSVRSRRLISTWMVGLSLADGTARWVSLISSAGSLPYQQGSTGSEAALGSEGLVYRGDDIGVVAVVEAATGRPVWVRRLEGVDSRATRRAGGRRFPSAPVLSGDRLIMLSSDGRRVLSFDAQTGDPGPVADVADVGPFARLTLVGDLLVAQSTDRAVVLDPNALDAGAGGLVRFNGARRAPVGVPTAIGDRVLFPVTAGVLVIDPKRSTEQLIELDASGHTVAADGQLVVASAVGVHSYLAWDAAAGVLSERIAAYPRDPSPATTFAELAYSSGRFEQILGAIDSAVAAVNVSGVAAGEDLGRERLFNSIRAMIEASQSRWDADPDDAVEARVITDAGLLRDLIDRLTRLATGPTERVAALLARGRFNEASGRAAAALESYQLVLSDEELSAANWRGAGLSVRAELEASRRLDRLLSAGPPSLYEPFDSEAELRLGTLAPDASARDIERVARAYPAALSSVEAWRRVAEAHERSGRTHEAARAGRAALDAAARLLRLGREVNDDEIGVASSWLLVRLVATGRLDEAARLVQWVQTSFPGASLDVQGAGAADAASLLRELSERLALAEREPRVGPRPRIDQAPQQISGYLLEPVHSVTASGTDVGRSWADGALVMDSVSGSLRFVGPSEDGAGVEARWSVPWERDPILLRRDTGTAWMMTPHEGGGVRVHRVSLADGAIMWSTPPWAELVGDLVSADPAIAAGEGPRRISPPIGLNVNHRQVVVTGDDQTLVLVERTGRVVAIDAGHGAPLWRAAMPITRVFEADVLEGALVLAGEGPSIDDLEGVGEGALVPGGGLVSALSIIDARSGEIMSSRDLGDDSVFWARLIPGGVLLTGHDSHISALDVSSNRALWRLDDRQFAGATDAFVEGDRIFVRRQDGRFGLVEASTGRVLRGLLQDRGRLGTRPPLRVYARSGAQGQRGGLTFATTTGYAVFDVDGRVVGLDALGQASGVVPAAAGRDHAITLQTRDPGPAQTDGPAFSLHVLDRGSGRLLSSTPISLYGLVRRVEVIDGFALLGIADLVTVIEFPTSGD